jgi:adhesin/invasin
VTVEGAHGNVVTGYRGTVHFTSSDSSATLPKDHTFTASDAGVHTLSNAAILPTRDTQTITIIDTQDSALTATDTASVG